MCETRKRIHVNSLRGVKITVYISWDTC